VCLMNWHPPCRFSAIPTEDGGTLELAKWKRYTESDYGARFEGIREGFIRVTFAGLRRFAPCPDFRFPTI